jgi:hypothetical protein
MYRRGPGQCDSDDGKGGEPVATSEVHGGPFAGRRTAFGTYPIEAARVMDVV